MLNTHSKWLLWAIAVVLALDQTLKWLLLQQYSPGDIIYNGSVISLVLVLNDGVAFSMLSFLGEWLKLLQLLLLGGIAIYLYTHKELISTYPIALGTILGAGLSNVLDRFFHGGVVDYVFWHYMFEFAVFNLADVMINLSVASIIYKTVLRKDKSA